MSATVKVLNQMFTVTEDEVENAEYKGLEIHSDDVFVSAEIY